jgi:hypothetical protein
VSNKSHLQVVNQAFRIVMDGSSHVIELDDGKQRIFGYIDYEEWDNYLFELGRPPENLGACRRFVASHLDALAGIMTEKYERGEVEDWRRAGTTLKRVNLDSADLRSGSQL